MLKKSTVTFYEDIHEYICESGVFLKGITGMIDRQIFGGVFANLPEEIWKDKAAYGTTVHTDIEMAIIIGALPNSPEGMAFYTQFIETGMIKPLCPEYLVSDEVNFATKIDLVDEDYNLYDFKTSTVLNVESVTWQLSICAYLFEKQNGFPCGKLFAVHLTPEKAELIELTPKSFQMVEELLQAEATGKAYLAPNVADDYCLAKVADLEKSIIAYKKAVEQFEWEKDKLLENLSERMIDMGIKKWETEKVSITRIDPTTRESIDSKILRAEMPEIFSKYAKPTAVKGGIRVTLKKQN